MLPSFNNCLELILISPLNRLGKHRRLVFSNPNITIKLQFQMHIALTSRDAELEYLEELSKRLLPLVIKVIKDYY